MICVMGLGFVGLTTALGFAHYGHKVYGYDIDGEMIEKLKERKLSFLEPELDSILLKELDSHFFIAEEEKDAMILSSIIFFCTGTPCGENGEADLSHLLTAIGACIKTRDLQKKYTFVIKSTIPPTTTEEVIIPFMERMGVRVGKDINVVNNPEFLREGHCWEDFIHADRIVIGCKNKDAEEVLADIYKPFQIPMYFVSYSTGEFIKYLSNTLLATMISFSNEMSEIAEEIGTINIRDAFRILHLDKRWNGCDMKSYVYPGCGYGGYCLPKDTKALYMIAQKRGIDTGILQNVIKVNDNMAVSIVRRVKKNIQLLDRIGILGLAFKPESDDVRDSPAAKVIKELIQQKYRKIVAYDPVATANFKSMYQFEISYEEDLYKLEEQVDVIIILTAWDEFKNIKESSTKLILDYRYM